MSFSFKEKEYFVLFEEKIYYTKHWRAGWERYIKIQEMLRKEVRKQSNGIC